MKDVIFGLKSQDCHLAVYQSSKSTHNYPKNMKMRRDMYTYKGWAGGVSRNALRRKRDRGSERVKGLEERNRRNEAKAHVAPRSLCNSGAQWTGNHDR